MLAHGCGLYLFLEFVGKREGESNSERCSTSSPFGDFQKRAEGREKGAKGRNRIK
jgi:hypothetical protein